jgi:hypothetical protein
MSRRYQLVCSRRGEIGDYLRCPQRQAVKATGAPIPVTLDRPASKTMAVIGNSLACLSPDP